jgi:hypothetical protein
VRKAAPALGIGDGLRREHLDRYKTIEMRIAGFVDDAHTALTELPEDRVVRKRSADHHRSEV